LKMGIGAGPYTKYGASTIRAYDYSNKTGPPTVLWTSEPSIDIPYQAGWYGPRFAADGKQFIVDSVNWVSAALDLNTGEFLWIKNVKSSVENGCYADGKVFFNGEDNWVFAQDANTGEVLWYHQTPAGAAGLAFPPAYAYGNVYTYNHDGYLYAIDANTGGLTWKYAGMVCWGNETHRQITDMPYTSHILADGMIFGDNVQYRGCSVGPPPNRGGNKGTSRFTANDAHTGELIWSCERWMDSHYPSIADGNLYGSDAIFPRSFLYSDYKALTGEYSGLYCIGMGPTEFSEFSVDKPKVKVGETVKISGRLVDASPGWVGTIPAWAEPEERPAPAPNVAVNITYVVADGVRRPIAYVKTDEEGRFSFEWTPYVEGVVQIRADSWGNDAYKPPENAYTVLFTVPAMDLVPVFEAVAVAAIVVAVALPVIVYLRMRKPR
jgi:outer membrane protein assembly factor BamB